MKIAILGASSQIAGDLIRNLQQHTTHQLSLFGRIAKPELGMLSYSAFGEGHYDALINFVGVGDPARAVNMGTSILEVTEQYDLLALDYLKIHPTCRYVFLSSGAVYGGAFNSPVTASTPACYPINSLGQQDWYGLAKLHAETRHRAHANLPIVDLRVFNYFSKSQSIDSRFLITDALRAARDGKVFKTNALDLVRDFLGEADFFALISRVLEAPPCNLAIDCFSAAPLKKFEMLDALQHHFGLQYDVEEQAHGVNATGVKLNYYSLHHAPALALGYQPLASSLDTVLQVGKSLTKTQQHQ
ncbi:MAG TPA: NAD-dependent epimerase/dehydratase family protein [Limnobacter sp.]|nr:NAD-dependent epimerase/dehydratase family protein [Limnobacter sp.]